MTDTSIYKDIAERTGGDVYIGVVGPVRTGKSTFIKRFMESLVLPRPERASAYPAPQRTSLSNKLARGDARGYVKTTRII